jgi:hypothetical protein
VEATELELPSGAAWAYANVSEPTVESAIRRNCGTLYVVTAEGHLRSLGTCFLVSRTSGQLLAVTAAHVLDWGLRQACPDRLSPKPLKEWPDHFLRSAQSRIVFRFGDQAFGQSPRLVTFFMSSDSDVAWMAIDPVGALSSDPGAGVFAIDSDLHAAGARIIAMCGADLDLQETPEPGVYESDPSIQLRVGAVTQVLRRGRLTTMPIYETDIPFEPGMSGSPVLLAPSGASAPMSVIGIVSSSVLSDQVVSDPWTPGHSVVVPIVASYALTFTDGEGVEREFSDLVGAGLVKDNGSRAARVEVERSLDGSFKLTIPQ